MSVSSETDAARTRPVNMILGLTGSVASIKLDELVDSLVKKFTRINICIVPTQNSLHFAPNLREKYSKPLNERLELLKNSSEFVDNSVFAFVDEDEWTSWSRRNDPVLHIELRKWADIILIAPLDANTLGKVSHGLCDNLLTSVLRAWDVASIKLKPAVICPAMNTCMYKHPLTRRQLDLLVNEFGFTLIDSVSKLLMCNDFGVGAMASVDTIVDTCFDICSNISLV
jgi:phosphopantothenoylcysteine decarboxylase